MDLNAPLGMSWNISGAAFSRSRISGIWLESFSVSTLHAKGRPKMKIEDALLTRSIEYLFFKGRSCTVHYFLWSLLAFTASAAHFGLQF